MRNATVIDTTYILSHKIKFSIFFQNSVNSLYDGHLYKTDTNFVRLRECMLQKVGVISKEWAHALKLDLFGLNAELSLAATGHSIEQSYVSNSTLNQSLVFSAMICLRES